MGLPINEEENDRILAARPGDALYPIVKDAVNEVRDNEQPLRRKLVSLILEGMTGDLALSNSLNEVGEVIEYLCQEYQIERPNFKGVNLMKDFDRIGKLKMSVAYAKLFGIEGAALELLLKAEVDRLWGDTAVNLLRKQIMVEKATRQVSIQPKETGVAEK